MKFIGAVQLWHCWMSLVCWVCLMCFMCLMYFMCFMPCYKSLLGLVRVTYAVHTALFILTDQTI